MLAFEGTKGFDANFKKRTIDVVESEETAERAEGLTSGRDWPVGDEVKFRFRWAVAIWCNVMTHVFYAVCEEFTLFKLEGHAIFHEDVANTGE
jgi:hypothetical protein